MVYRILYCSRSCIAPSGPERQAALDAILATARRANAAAEITGALLLNGDAFAQILEGPRNAVETIYARIRFDPRHTDVLTLEHAHQPTRYFTDWAMAFAHASSLRLLAPSTLDLDSMHRNPHGFSSRILQMLRESLAAHARPSHAPSVPAPTPAQHAGPVSSPVGELKPAAEFRAAQQRPARRRPAATAPATPVNLLPTQDAAPSRTLSQPVRN